MGPLPQNDVPWDDLLEDDDAVLLSETGPNPPASAALAVRPTPPNASVQRPTSFTSETTRMQRVAPPTPNEAPPFGKDLLDLGGVVAFALTDAEGNSLAVGGADGSELGARVAYFRTLAELVGEELGLSGLGTLQLVGSKTKLLSVARMDGSFLHVLATARVDVPSALALMSAARKP